MESEYPQTHSRHAEHRHKLADDNLRLLKIQTDLFYDYDSIERRSSKDNQELHKSKITTHMDQICTIIDTCEASDWLLFSEDIGKTKSHTYLSEDYPVGDIQDGDNNTRTALIPRSTVSNIQHFMTANNTPIITIILRLGYVDDWRFEDFTFSALDLDIQIKSEDQVRTMLEDEVWHPATWAN